MKNISVTALVLTLCRFPRAVRADIDRGDGSSDNMFVECESVCVFACSNDSEVTEVAELAHHPDVLGAIPWSRLSANELKEIDRQLHQSQIVSALHKASREVGSRKKQDRNGPLADRFAGYAEIARSDPEMFGWPCYDHCKYECMHKVVEDRQRTVKFFGKWPFQRGLICQEILSSVYSLLNGLPYFVYALTRTFREISPRAFQVYNLIVGVMWLFSAIFHCRDTTITMYMDYSAATAGVYSNCSLAMYIYLFDSRKNNPRRSWAMQVMGLLWFLHVGYMIFVDFNFDLNMKVSVLVGSTGSAMFIAWYLRNRKVRPHAWLILPSTLGLFPPLVAFELNDFPPPPMGFADAHSYWHLCTIPISACWALFLYRESQFLTKKPQKSS